MRMLGGANLRAVILTAMAAILARAQAPPACETISIHRSSGDFTPWMEIPPDYNTVTISNEPFREIIAFGYHVDPALVFGGPYYTDHAVYDIEARAAGPATLPQAERREMLRAWLAQTVQLKVHRETRSVHAYLLVVEKHGLKMKERHAGDGGETSGILAAASTGNWQYHMSGRFVSMKDLAESLESTIYNEFPVAGHRLIVDQTRLTGKYDFDLSWTRPSAVARPIDLLLPNAPYLFAAITEQLGLKLRGTKIRREVVVIDRLKIPSDP